MFQTYSPSGRFSTAVVVWLILGALAIAVAGGLYSLALQWIPFIYVNFMLTLGMGWLVGRFAESIVKQGKVRNRSIAISIAIVLALVGIGSKFSCQYYRDYQRYAESIDRLQAREIEAEFGERLDARELAAFKAAAKQSYTFVEHIKSRVSIGWNLGKAGRNGAAVSEWFVYLIWSIELGAVLYIALPMAFAAAGRPFAEQLDTWADESEVVMVLPITDDKMVDRIESARTVQDLLELPIPTTDVSTRFAIYTIHSIPGQELEDAYVTVDLQEFLTKSDGESEVKSKNLVSLAVITSAQRGQLKENAELMKEAIQDYRASQATAEAEPPSGTPGDHDSDLADE